MRFKVPHLFPQVHHKLNVLIIDLSISNLFDHFRRNCHLLQIRVQPLFQLLPVLQTNRHVQALLLQAFDLTANAA
jgi:hypothetical protein